MGLDQHQKTRGSTLKIVLPAILFATLATGCASTVAHQVGAQFGVEFSAQQRADRLTIECSPPSWKVPADWVDECNSIATLFLLRQLGEGRIDDFSEPPFGMAGQAVRRSWDELLAMGAGVQKLTREIRLQDE